MKSRPQRPTSTGWSPTMERRAADRDGKQVKCRTAEAGHIYMPSYDDLPPAVRRRLAESPFNLCAACLDIDAHEVAARLGKKLSVAIYLAVIRAIERKLEGDNL